MGEVHRARAFGAAGVTKELCIKRIRCERLADPAALERFVAEARVSMRLSHANIVSVFDFGRSDNDYYLAMEWVDGCDLRQLLTGHEDGLDEDVALAIGVEIARALAYVHGLGDDLRLAHCDLKPANVLVSRAGEVKLADFGVAVAEASAAAGGTRRYMAPEQRSGGVVSPAVDLYSLGLVLDELLGGKAALTIEETRSYVPPAKVSPALGVLLARLCAEDPSARPASAAEVVDALEALLAEARVRTKRSPRDRLSQEVAARKPVETEGEESEGDFRTDASFVTEGQSATFERRMKPGRSASEPRPTPLPPRPASSPWPMRVALGVMAVVLVAITWPFAQPPRATTTSHAPPSPASPTQAATDEPVAPVIPVSPPASATIGLAAPVERRVPRPAPPSLPDPPPTTVVVALPAHVRLNARPWADVTIDGRAQGITPLVDVALPPGAHEIVFSNPALGVTRTEHVVLSDGEQRDVIVDLRTAP